MSPLVIINIIAALICLYSILTFDEEVGSEGWLWFIKFLFVANVAVAISNVYNGM
jgi:hypothetical protein